MKLLCPCLVLLLAVAAPLGCARKQISDIDRKKAANLASEAQFAATVREYPRAEGLLVEATKLTPDAGQYWLSLGTVRMKEGHNGDARSAYKHALDVFGGRAKTDPRAALQQVYVLALLGRVDEAHARLQKLPQRFPQSADVRSFVEGKQLDGLLADPKFKELQP